MKKRAILGLLSLSILFSAACSKTPQSETKIYNDAGAYSVWTAPATEKICRNVKYSGERTSGTALDISMCRNEYEGAQIIITADENKSIEEYTVSASPLISGTNIIPAENVSFYNEKYIEILHKFNSNKEFPVNTFVPDALLPFDTAVEYDENKVKAGENQGIYVEVRTEAFMSPGLYTGNVSLTVDGKTTFVPMRVTVYDFTISETGTAQSYCSTYGRDSYATLELDASDDMATAYYETWLKYRMNGDLPYAGKGGPERYVELLREYYFHEGFATYRFWYNCHPGGATEYKGITTNGIKAEELKEHLSAVVKASVEDRVNYLDKAMFYYSNWIDEPTSDEAFENVRNCLTFHNLILTEVEAEMRHAMVAEENYDYYLSVVSPTLLDIPVVLPEVDIETKSRIDAMGIDNLAHCPVIQLLGTKEMRDYYASDENDDYWSYTCVQPVYPYPSNHLDDYLVGWRTLFWMQKAFGYKGYLNWAFCNYITDNSYSRMADAYADDIRGFYPGDGFMFYPGAPYGIYGPVASLRCIAFRDGMEEYEYLTALEDTYASAGLSSKYITDALYNRLFNGAVPTTSSEVLLDTKKQLCETIESASGDYGMIITDTAMNGTVATVSFVMMNPEVEVYMGNTKLTGENGRYSVTLNLISENHLELDIKYKGNTVRRRMRIAGSLAIVKVETQSDLNMFGVKPESSVALNRDTAFVMNDGASAKFTLRGKYFGIGQESQTYSYEPFIRINTSVFGDISKTENIYLNVYYAGEGEVPVNVSYYTNRNNHIADVVLKHGWNSVTLKNVYALDDIGSARYIFLRTANLLAADGKTELSIDLYVDDIVYSKL